MCRRADVPMSPCPHVPMCRPLVVRNLRAPPAHQGYEAEAIRGHRGAIGRRWARAPPCPTLPYPALPCHAMPCRALRRFMIDFPLNLAGEA
jgi:hypothetical protein